MLFLPVTQPGACDTRLGYTVSYTRT